MKHLPDVTLIAVSCIKHGETLAALNKSLRHIRPARTILLTDVNILCDEGIEVVRIEPLTSIEDYNRFIIRELHRYFDTSHALLVQHDGYVLSEKGWTDEFLSYDYIGACWNYADRNVGNGGFSLRSKKLQQAVALAPFFEILSPEDEVIGRLYRRRLEAEYGIRFAPEELADRFSFETRMPTRHTFGFHGHFHHPFRDHVVIKRTGALGDVIMAEPLMDYFNQRGYQVVLDTQPQNMDVFFMHHYSVLHLSQVDERIRPERYIDLDMAYEQKPRQLVLQSYYEAAGISDGMLRNARLSYPVGPQNKLFPRYAVIHIDDTGIPHRNVRGIDWKEVRRQLENEGYLVLQVGKNRHEQAGYHINTAALKFLMYVVAGCDLFIGTDSGVGQVAVALGRPSVLLFGSVNPRLRYTSFKSLAFVQQFCPYQHCYHETVGVRGTDCVLDREHPPCTNFDTKQLLKKINELLWATEVRPQK